jgi:branched-chain amino acid transport system ATP-binding protein
MMSGAVLELDAVSASYSTYRALFGVSFSVADDGIVALLGSNGAGKSTVARVVSGLVPASSGSIRVAGEDVTKCSAHHISGLGLAHVPEGRAIFSSLTVEENLTLSFRKRVGRKSVADALERAYCAFPVLAERRRQVGGTLSGGQQRILSLAKVLAVSPRLLIADELSLGLAPVIVDQVYDGLVAIHRQGCALLVVEQQVDRALAIADRAVLLVKGAVAWEGPARDARPALDAHMLGGTTAGNGARPYPHSEPAPAFAASPAPPSAPSAPVAPVRPAPPAAPAPPMAPNPPVAPPPPVPPGPPARRWTPRSAPPPTPPRPPVGRSDDRNTPPPDLWV